MASNAERQAAYRKRQFEDGVATRLNLVVSPSAKAQLERLAAHSGVSQRAMLERLLASAESELTQEMNAADQRRYYSGSA